MRGAAKTLNDDGNWHFLRIALIFSHFLQNSPELHTTFSET